MKVPNRSMEESVKLVYNSSMKEFYANRPCDGPWTREWVADIILKIYQKKSIDLGQWDIYQTHWKEKYIIIMKDNKYQLMSVLESHGNLSSIVPVLPWEESFGPIWKAHLACGHGNLTKTMNLLKKKFYINLNFVDTLINACICKKDKVVPQLPHYNAKGFVEILEMSMQSDQEFNYILMYKDIGSKLIQLRPLAQVNELETSLELVKIFTDLGPPLSIVVYGPYFYQIVIKNVNKVFSPYNIKLEYDLSYTDTMNLQDITHTIYAMLQDWMKTYKTKDWALGCYKIQTAINSTLKDD